MITNNTCPHCGAEQDTRDPALYYLCDSVKGMPDIRTLKCLKRQVAQQAAEIERLRGALSDILFGWHYIRLTHGDLSGVDWDGCQNNAVAALKKVK